MPRAPGKIKPKMAQSTSTGAPTSVHCTNASTVDIVCRKKVSAVDNAYQTSAPAVNTAQPTKASAVRSFPFEPFEFRGPPCAVWYKQKPQPPLSSSLSQTCPVPRASLAPPLTAAETALWRAEPFNLDIDKEWLLFEAEQSLCDRDAQRDEGAKEERHEVHESRPAGVYARVD
jgi:hypothetical protein